MAVIVAPPIPMNCLYCLRESLKEAEVSIIISSVKQLALLKSIESRCAKYGIRPSSVEASIGKIADSLSIYPIGTSLLPTVMIGNP